MVETAKKVIDSRGFDQMLKVLTIIQTLLIAVLLPLVYSLSNDQHKLSSELAAFRSEMRAKLPSEFPPGRWQDRIVLLEKELNKLKNEMGNYIAATKHLLESKK